MIWIIWCSITNRIMALWSPIIELWGSSPHYLWVSFGKLYATKRNKNKTLMHKNLPATFHFLLCFEAVLVHLVKLVFLSDGRQAIRRCEGPDCASYHHYRHDPVPWLLPVFHAEDGGNEPVNTSAWCQCISNTRPNPAWVPFTSFQVFHLEYLWVVMLHLLLLTYTYHGVNIATWLR